MILSHDRKQIERTIGSNSCDIFKIPFFFVNILALENGKIMDVQRTALHGELVYSIACQTLASKKIRSEKIHATVS